MMDKRTLLDELGDPASWAGAPLGFAPPEDVYVNARLSGARIVKGDLVITVDSPDTRFETTLTDDSFTKLTAPELVEILTPYFGGLLLNVLAHEISEPD